MSQIPSQNEPPVLKPKGIKCVAMLICPYIHPLLSDYIGTCTPEFTSDTFRKMFGKGNLSYEILKSKENNKINLSSFFSLNHFLFEGLNIQFPDEKMFFVFECTKAKIVIDYRNWYKEKLESFIDYALSQIEGKKNPLEERTVKSAIDNIKKQFFWDNFKINVNDVEIILRWQQTIECVLSIKKVFYDHKEQKGEIKEISITIKDNIKKLSWNIVNPFDIDIVYQGDINQLKFELKSIIKLTIQETMYESVEMLSKIFNKKGTIDSHESDQNNNNNILYENIDKEDNIDVNQCKFEVISLVKNSSSIIKKRLLDKKEKAKKEAKKPSGFFGFSWGKKQEDNDESKPDEPVKLLNEEIEKLNTLLSDESVKLFIKGIPKEKSTEDKNKNTNTNLFSLPQISPVFEFNNNNIELVVEFEIKKVTDSFKLEITNITYNNETLTYQFGFSLLLVNQQSYIISSSLYTINIKKEENTNTSIINANFDSLTITISVDLIQKLKQLYNILLNSNIAGILKSLNFSQTTDSMKDNLPSNMKLNLTNNKIEVIYVEEQCTSSVTLTNSLITILPPSETQLSNDKKQPNNISLQTNQIDLFVNNNSPLFLSFVEFLFLYDPNATNNNNNNNNNNENKSNETSHPLELDFVFKTFNIIYYAKPTKITFSLIDLNYKQNSTLIDLSSSSFQAVINPKTVIFVQQKKMSIIYDLPKNNFVMTMPSPNIIFTDETLDTFIKAFTLDLDIDIEIIDFVFVVILSEIIINYNLFFFNIKSFEIGNNKRIYLSAQIDEFMIKLKNKRLLTEKKIELNITEDKQKNKKEIDINFSELNVSVIQNDLYNLLLQVKFKDLLSQKENNSIIVNENKLKQTQKKNTIYTINVQLNCINFKLLLLKQNKSNANVTKTNTVSVLSLHNMKYIYFPGNSSNEKEKQIVMIQYITCIFVDSFNKEHIILTQVNESFQNKSINEVTTETNTPNTALTQYGDQQIIITKKDELINITINSIQLLLRFDAILFLYYFFYNSIPFKRIANDVSNIKPKYNIEINLLNIYFLLQTDYVTSDIFLLELPSIKFVYSVSKKNPFPLGLFFIHIEQIQGYFTSLKNISQKRIFISSKHKVSYFLTTSVEITNFQKMTFNLSITDAHIHALYTDFISLLKAYQFNKFYINNEHRLAIETSNDQIQVDTKQQETEVVFSSKNASKFDINKANITISFTWESLNVTLIDDAKNKYLPFMTFTMNDFTATSTPNNFIQVIFQFNIDSYNYIALTWEPTIEKFRVQALMKYSVEQRLTTFSFQGQSETLLLNISDMNASFVFAALSNWIDHFQSEKTKYEEMLVNLKNTNNVKVPNPLLNQTQPNLKVIVSNNTVMNYSAETIQIGYNDNNIVLNSLEKANLEYHSEMKERFIDLKYKEQTFKIPIEKIGSIMNNVNKDCYFISEIALTKERTIDINIYSPIVILNQTNSNIQIIIKPSINSSEDNSNIFILEHNHQQGIPFSLLSNPNTVFNFVFNNELSNCYSLNEVLSTPLNGTYVKSVNFKQSKTFQLKMINDIPNVRKLVIGYEYSIVNALPFKLTVYSNNKKWGIQKGNKVNIDAKQDDLLQFEFFCDNVLFFVKGQIFQLFDQKRNNRIIAEKRSNITFKDINQRELNIKTIFNSKKELILYAEYVITNDSGIPLEIRQEGSKKAKIKNFIYYVNNNIYIISSLEELEKCSIYLQSSKFLSHKISFETLLESSSKINITLSQNSKKNFDENPIHLRIRDELSYVAIENDPLFSETIITRIFSITGTCFIFNQLPDKEILIRSFLMPESTYHKFPPLTKLNFHHSNHMIPISIVLVDLKTKKNHSIHEFTLSNGVTTLYVLNCFINIEIRVNNFDNITEMFIYECNFRNAKIILDNKSSYDVFVQQINHLNEFQIVNSKTKEICKIYDHLNLELLIGSDDKVIKLNCINFQQNDIIPISGKIYVQRQTNGVKTKITFFDKNELNSISNCFISKYDFSFSISQIIISLISDNEFIHKKVNKNYKRNEISLIVLNSTGFEYKLLQKHALEINEIQLNVQIKGIIICNQISEFGKYPIFIENIEENKSNQFLVLKCCFNNYPIDNLSTLTFFALSMDKMRISVDPNFLFEILNFMDNIAYRSNVSFHNINEIFINKPNNEPKKDLLQFSSSNIHLIHGKNISLPEINIKLKLSKIGLHELLKNKFGFSSFSCKIIQQLAGHTNKIKLEKFSIQLFRGGFLDFIQQIIDTYHTKAAGLVNSIGLRGIALALPNVFKKEEGISEVVKDNRLRPPRNFYGKYRYIQNFNHITANIQKDIMDNYIDYPFLKGHHFVNGIHSSNQIFLFTTITMFAFNRSKKPVCETQIDYFCIQDVKWDINDGSMLSVMLTQTIDNANYIDIDTHTKGMGKFIGYLLLEYRQLYKDELSYVD